MNVFDCATQKSGLQDTVGDFLALFIAVFWVKVEEGEIDVALGVGGEPGGEGEGFFYLGVSFISISVCGGGVFLLVEVSWLGDEWQTYGLCASGRGRKRWPGSREELPGRQRERRG